MKKNQTTIPGFRAVYHAPSGKTFANTHREPVRIEVDEQGKIITATGPAGAVQEVRDYSTKAGTCD